MAVCFYEYRDYKRNSNYTYNLCDLLMELTLVITSWIGVVAVIVFVSPGIVMFRKKWYVVLMDLFGWMHCCFITYHNRINY